MTYDIVLIEKPLDDGLSQQELSDCMQLLKPCGILPVSIDSTSGQSVAMGLMTMHASNELDGDISGLSKFLGDIMADINKESADGIYIFSGLTILMSRNIAPQSSHIIKTE